MRFLITVVAFCFSLVLCAQNNKFGLVVDENRSKLTLTPEIDRNALFSEDSLYSVNHKPLIVALSYPLIFDALNIGIWSKNKAGGETWELKIKSPDAYGFLITFSDFYIPSKGVLYVYNGEADQYPTTYTSDDNTNSGRLVLGIDSGDEMILKYESSSIRAGRPQFISSALQYNLKDENGSFFFPGKKRKSMLKSSDCLINISCSDGNDWQKQKRGVVKLLVERQNNSVHLCTGSLINNTKKDKTLYVLTASHCFDYPEGVAKVEKTKFIFNYEAPSCNSQEKPQFKTIEGAEILVFNRLRGGSDGTLLKMTESVPSNNRVYFNGWELTNDPKTITSGAIIHHPSGALKKISIFNTPPTTSWWQGAETAMQNAHFEVGYSQGITEGGSSGAPMFNQDGLIVATLTGGNSTCSEPESKDDYGKLFYHWNKDSNPNNHMQKYLDPENTGVTYLKGINYDYNPNVELGNTPLVTMAWGYGVIEIESKATIKKITVTGLNGYNVMSEDNINRDFKNLQTYDWLPGIYIIVVECDKEIRKTFKILKK